MKKPGPPPAWVRLHANTPKRKTGPISARAREILERTRKARSVRK